MALNAETLSDQGALTLELLQQTRWIARRVETVRFLDTSRLERRITLDLNAAELKQLATTCGVSATGTVLLPLIVLEKGLLLDLDLTVDGTSRPISTSDADSMAATGALVQTLSKAGVDVKKLPQSVLKTILNATRTMPGASDLEVLRVGYADVGTVDAWRLVEDPNKSDQENEQDAEGWEDLLDANDAFWSLLRNFTASFMLMTEVKLGEIPEILKIRYVETQDPPELGFLEKIGLAPYFTLVEAPGVTTAAREHLRIEAPPGVLLEEAALWSLDERLTPGQKALPSSGDRTYQRRLTLERTALYTAKLPGSSFAVALSMRANPSGFLRRAQYVIGLGFLMILAGAVAQLAWDTLTDVRRSNADPTVAMMLLVPTLLVAYVAREGDHQVLSDLLRAPRLLVASTGLVTLACAGGLVAGVPGAYLCGLWFASAAWCLVVLVWLRAVNMLSQSVIEDVRENQGTTSILPVTIFQF